MRIISLSFKMNSSPMNQFRNKLRIHYYHCIPIYGTTYTLFSFHIALFFVGTINCISTELSRIERIEFSRKLLSCECYEASFSK